MEDEVVVDGQNGGVLTLRRTTGRDAEGGWTYEAMLVLPEARATVSVYDYGTSLAPFFRELAEAWRGLAGVKK